MFSILWILVEIIVIFDTRLCLTCLVSLKVSRCQLKKISTFEIKANKAINFSGANAEFAISRTISSDRQQPTNDSSCFFSFVSSPVRVESVDQISTHIWRTARSWRRISARKETERKYQPFLQVKCRGMQSKSRPWTWIFVYLLLLCLH